MHFASEFRYICTCILQVNIIKLIHMKQTALSTETKYAEVNSKIIAYRTLGSGEPILLVNRFRGTLDTWDPLFLDLLATKHTVITFDYEGIGYSGGELPLNMKDVAAGIIDFANVMKLDTFHVMGWSYGGLVVQYLAFLYPDRVKKAVLLGTNPIGKNEIPFEPAFFEHALKPVNSSSDYEVIFFEPNSERSRQAAKSSWDRIAERADSTKIPATPELFQRYFAATAGVKEDQDDLRKEFAHTSVPLLAISGDHDISFAIENWYPIVRNAPTTQLIVLPESGHAPQFQYPELSVGYIHSFLNN